VKVNLFNPGPIRTRMRAKAMPGEDPMTLDTPEQAAEAILQLCLPSCTESGRIYDYKTKAFIA
jgi:NAD(P)-dependent dehydrogenase (short-subunit alcohol dehydrogenase family)